MIFLGYNFLRDAYSAQPTPSNLTNLTNIKIENGIYDHFNVTKDVSFSYTNVIPLEWTLSTKLNADFDNSINAGNIDYVISEISSIRVKRRIKGTFNWITLFDVPVNSVEDVDFTKNDFTNQSEIEYEYAIVPVIGNIEGEYSVSEIKSQFYGVFITDNEKSYKFSENVKYASNERVNLSAVYNPYGSKYPILVQNGNINYERGNLSGDVIVFDSSSNIDRLETVNRLSNIKEFLKNKNAKILKDFNGNIWLIQLDGNIGSTYYSEIGMGIANVTFNWVEIGDVNSGKDLYKNGLISYYE